MEQRVEQSMRQVVILQGEEQVSLVGVIIIMVLSVMVAFGGTGNLTNGTLGGTSFTSVTNGISFGGSIGGGHRYASAYNTNDIGSQSSPFRTLYYATALTKVSDIRLKDDFENVENIISSTILSLFITQLGSYTLEGRRQPSIRGINANLVDNLFPK